MAMKEANVETEVVGRCSEVWGFGSFAVRCRRKHGHKGLHSGGRPRMVWGKA